MDRRTQKTQKRVINRTANSVADNSIHKLTPIFIFTSLSPALKPYPVSSHSKSLSLCCYAVPLLCLLSPYARADLLLYFKKGKGAELASLLTVCQKMAVAMASIHTMGRWTVKMCSASKSPEPNREQVDVNLSSRRWAVAASAAAACLSLVSPSPMSVALARERRNRKTIPPEDYLAGPDGLKYYDVVQGSGPVAESGTTVQVHFDCIYRGITALSSRESKLLAGNRAIAQPYEFKVGSPPGKERKRDFVDNPNGLFSAQASPKPPPAMYKITQGMRVGGKRTVIVPPEAGYGQKGMNEIPPGATFQLNIELLRVEAPEKKNVS